ncbi:MAG: phosphotriesterase [Dehalococcoidia bacterium]
MATVQTIRGPIASDQLGRALSHEHLTAGGAGMERLPWIYDESEAVAGNLDALRRVKAAGIDSLIDLTPLDLGRQISLFQRVADADTGVNIVCATGVYRWVPMYFLRREIDEIADHFLRELRDGIEGTGIRPGIIKLAWDLEYRMNEGRPGFTPRDGLERTARAAARAAKAAGVPISCHTLATDELGTPLLDIFADEGLDLRAVTIGHSNDSADLEYLKGLAARGATVGLDRYSSLYPEEERIRRAEVALALAQAGYAEQICLGHDGSPYMRLGAMEPNPDCWLQVPNFEVPWLREHGATEDQIDAMLRRSVQATFEAAARMATSAVGAA